MLVPSDDEFVDAFGVSPEAEDEPWIKAVQVEGVRVSFDAHVGSLRVQWFQDDELVVDLYREGANRMLVWSGKGESHVVVEFGDGEMSVRIHPAVRITSRHN
ncbi:hypothetical protein SK803_19655 [Lentzea sp. BCCO 10_0856]|uniref:Uncharacterized protein n=1 Tax=Lentzea miocenica TaxID=3095431 RepID=A0ABU4T2Q4_9PSEU|nr:hypothetical protein [Lentzea sp. BCCO 10_0856]MDX8032434.1 hypothetical protein [Lentzea sp. BCCO 10_0856]